MPIELKYPRYEFTPVLGWSVSRYEVFDKCKRQYYYQYYSKFVDGVPLYRIKQLKALTSVPLEIGNVVHDVLEMFLKRLQKSDSNIDENRFFDYARRKAHEYFSTKTFLETCYGTTDRVDFERAAGRIERCLSNFMNSPVYNWIFMKAMTNRKNWMIEPPGYGETRIEGLKAYCKMDFLFPLDSEVVILDWKTGKRDVYKHSHQLVAYAAAASSNFGIPRKNIFPRIVYLSPAFDEFELQLKENDFTEFFGMVKEQSREMTAFCTDIENNVPRPIDDFPMKPSVPICNACNFQELCFPERKNRERNTAPEV